MSQKGTSEVSVSQRRRSPSARSALAAYVYLVVSRTRFSEVVRKHERNPAKKRSFFEEKFEKGSLFSRISFVLLDYRSFFEEKFDAEGVSPLLAPEGGSGFAEARPTLP